MLFDYEMGFPHAHPYEGSGNGVAILDGDSATFG